MKEYNLKPPANVIVETSTRPYAYEVSLDCTAKGWIQPSVKVRSDDLQRGETEINTLAIILLDKLVKNLKDYGYKVATDIEEVQKNGKD